jgi:hypothetical protein
MLFYPEKEWKLRRRYFNKNNSFFFLKVMDSEFGAKVCYPA